MKLRGHHLFCTALFSGHGYSEEFTKKMTALVVDLHKGERITVQLGADEICSVCPNRTDSGGCALSTEDVLRRDSAALRVLRLKPGETLNWQQAAEKLKNLTEPEFRSVCGGCRWQREGLCSLTLLQSRLA